MTDTAYERLKAAHDQATPGEWEVRSAYSHAVMANGAQVAITGDIMQVDQDRPLANAAFIVAAHNELPALLAENERLREANDHLQQFIDLLEDHMLSEDFATMMRTWKAQIGKG